jgi:glycosyltransferase involved in cell wall biosynthesis
VLVLPARDEEATVAAVVGRAPRTIAGRSVQVVVIDDGSADATAARARAAGADVVPQAGRGLGAAVRAGLAHAVQVHRAAAVAFCDADGEYAPEDLADLVLPVLDGRAHYVVGSRFTGTIGTMHRHRRVGNRLLTVAMRRLARTPITDAQSGYRALSRAAAAHATIIHDYNYAQVLTLDLLAKGYGYHEVPIRYSFRTSGRSFVQLHRYLRHVLPAVVRQLRTPVLAPAAPTARGASPAPYAPQPVGATAPVLADHPMETIP